MSCIALLRRLSSALLLATCAAQAQVQPRQATVSVAFANDLGDGPFRAALLRGLREELHALHMQLVEDAAARTDGHGYDGVVRVRSLAERVNAAGQPTFRATLSLSLVDPATGTGWLARVIRTDYPVVGASPLETLGEASGRRVASAICEVACAVPPRRPMPKPPAVLPSRRIIKESDW